MNAAGALPPFAHNLIASRPASLVALASLALMPTVAHPFDRSGAATLPGQPASQPSAWTSGTIAKDSERVDATSGRPALTEEVQLPPLHLMLIMQLDPQRGEYCPDHIATLFGVSPHAIRKTCRALWPRQGEGRSHYKLDWNEAAVLIWKHALNCRWTEKRRLRLWMNLMVRGVISAQFPIHDERVERATSAIAAHQKRRTKAQSG